jgi:hypothetical protein
MPAINNMRPEVLNASGVDHYPEGASQTFKAGDLVVLSSGRLVAGTGVAQTGLMLAAQDASGVAGTYVAVYRLDEDTRLVMSVSGTATATDEGTQMGVAVSSGITIAARADVTNLRLEVVKRNVGGAQAAVFGTDGDTGVRMIVKPLGLGTNWR